jgi:hypothetical protein
LSKHQRRYVRQDYRGILDRDWRLDLRLAEHVAAYDACIANPATKHIAKRMKRCRLDRRCGVLLCFLCRFLHAFDLNAKVQDAFKATPPKRLRFETVLIEAIRGTPDQLTRHMLRIITNFRKLNRLLAAREGIASSTNPLTKFGLIDLDVYYCDDVKQLWSALKSADKRKAVKIRLFKKLGWRSNWEGVFIVVHYHSIVAASSSKKYKRVLKRMMRGKRRVVVKPLFRTKPVAENLWCLSAYISKVGGRYGALPGSKKRVLLDPDPMRDLMIALEPFSFRTLKLHIGTSKSARRDLQNQISISHHYPGPSTPPPQDNLTYPAF